MKQPIVVGIDLTGASDDALIQAEARARRDGVSLTVVHAVGPALWGAAHESGEFDTIRRLIRERLVALTGCADDSFEVLVERGAPHAALARVAEARKALLVLGSHTERRMGHAFLRDVPERVSALARPVYVTKPKSGSKRVLIALASPLDDEATLDAGIEEARASASTLVVVHSVYMGFLEGIAKDLVNGGAYAAHPLGERSQVVRARRELTAELARKGALAELHVVDGPPDLAIPEVALRCEADLIVVGAPHAPAPLSRVASTVLRHAACSVLVVDAGSLAREAIVSPSLAV